MTLRDELKSAVLQITPESFNDLALEIFRFQAAENPVYQKYLQSLRVNPLKIKYLAQIPFLPIQFFKFHKIISGNAPSQFIFESSGTSGQITSKHFAFL